MLVDLVSPEHFPAHEAPDVERLHLHPVNGLQAALQVGWLGQTATHLRDLASPACDPDNVLNSRTFFFPLLQLRNYVSASLVYCDYTYYRSAKRTQVNFSLLLLP